MVPEYRDVLFDHSCTDVADCVQRQLPKKIYDVSRLWDNEMFAPLKNPSFFKNVKVETGGYAVYWNDNIDISERGYPLRWPKSYSGRRLVCHERSLCMKRDR